MAMTKAQKEIAVTLFANTFLASKDKQSRKVLFIEFSDAFNGSICDWKERAEQEIKDESLKIEFKELCKGEKKTDIKEYITIEALRADDLNQISQLARMELGNSSWIYHACGEKAPDSIDDFVEGGYSFVAKRENEVLGFILACKCPTYGGAYCLYIDTFVVGKDAQGLGIGKMLFAKIKENMFMDRIFSMKLMTQRERPAYKIYKHLGFKEIEEYVHMSRW